MAMHLYNLRIPFDCSKVKRCLFVISLVVDASSVFEEDLEVERFGKYRNEVKA